MKKIKYSQSTLENFTKIELQKICKYYGIAYKPAWSKSKLIYEIKNYSAPEIQAESHYYSGYEYVPFSVDLVPTEAKKSVRIQRIKDGKEK